MCYCMLYCTIQIILYFYTMLDYTILYYTILAQVTSLGYAVGEGHPFSAYGEGVPAFVGSLAVALQTLHYDRGARLNIIL